MEQPPGDFLECPECSEARVKNKKGKLVPICLECGHTYSTDAAPLLAAEPQTHADPPITRDKLVEEDDGTKESGEDCDHDRHNRIRRRSSLAEAQLAHFTLQEIQEVPKDDTETASVGSPDAPETSKMTNAASMDAQPRKNAQYENSLDPPVDTRAAGEDSLDSPVDTRAGGEDREDSPDSAEEKLGEEDDATGSNGAVLTPGVVTLQGITRTITFERVTGNVSDQSTSTHEDAVEDQHMGSSVGNVTPLTSIVFVATIHRELKKDLDPVVSVYGWLEQKYCHLTDMVEIDGVLRGEFLMECKSGVQELRYHYCVTSEKKDFNEQEHLTTDCRTADLTKSDNCVTLYDGMILVEPKGMWRAVKAIWSNNPYKAKLKGYKHILPDWIARFREGCSPEELKQQLYTATTQQIAHCSTYSPASSTREDIVKKLRNYLDEVYREHISLCTDSNLDTKTVYMSIICLFEIECKYSLTETNNVPPQVMKDISNFISKNLLELFPKTCDESLFDMCHTAHSKEHSLYLAIMISNLINKLEKSKSNAWVSLLPLLHALERRNSKTQGSDTSRDEWWGTTSEIGFCLYAMRQDTRYPYQYLHWLAKLQPFFKDCVVLPYTFMRMLAHDQLVHFLVHKEDAAQLIPLNPLLARAMFHIKQATTHIVKLELYEAVLVYMRRVTSSETYQFVDGNTIELASLFLVNFPTSEKVVYRAVPVKHWEKSHIAANIFVKILESYATHCDECDIGRLMGSLRAKLLTFVDDFKTVAFKPTATNIGSEELQGWDLMFRCHVSKPKIRELLMTVCQEKFTERAESVMRVNPQRVIELYLNHDFKIPEMESVVEQSALSVADDLLSGESGQCIYQRIENPKIWKLVDQALTKKWPEDNGDAFQMVEKLIELKSFVSICKIVWNLSEEDKKNNLSATSFQHLAQAVRSFEKVMSGLLDGSITVGQYRHLQSRKGTLLEFYEASEKLRMQRDDIVRMFHQREEEANQFHRFAMHLSAYWQSCRQCFADKRPVDDWLTREQTSLALNQLHDFENHEVICDAIPKDLRACLEPFSKLNRRPIFHSIYKNRIREVDGSWEGVIQAYHGAVQSNDEIAASLIHGTIRIERLEEVCTSYFKGNLNQLVEELPMIVEDTLQCEMRKVQIEGTSRIAQISDGAEVLLQLKKELDMKGDFTEIEQMFEVKNKRAELRDINLDMLNSVGRIRDISRQQADCLRAFIDCKEFVDWVKITVERKDISVFVGLASCALGEDDLSSQKTRYLMNALNGYAPLLYDLEKGAINFDKFIILCDQVWKEEETNHELPNNLIETARDLEFFKRVHSHFGNVEIASMAQATAINDTGVYHVGNIRNFSKELQSLDDVIQLKCRLKDANEKMKDRLYSYADLKGLQSKLTLVAGEKQKDNLDTIQEFDEMRDTVEKLAQAYIDVRKEGCIQFDDLLVVIHCNPSGEAAVEIILQSIGKKIFGRKSERTTLEHCWDVCKYLNRCVKAWRASMDQKRKEIPNLNYYTTEQLVILRKELGKYLHDQRKGQIGSLDKAMPLLAMIHTIKPSSLHAAMLDFEQPNPPNVSNASRTIITYQNLSDDQQDQLAEVEELKGFTDDLALQAVIELGFNQSDAAYLEWNRNQLAARQRVNELKKKESETTTDDVIMMIMETQPEESTLNTQLDSLWDRFIAHTSTSIKNFLGIPHLGHVLQKLKEMKPDDTKRELPEWLERGKPALIAVKERETSSMVLTIYEADRSAPPPTRNNVLLCSKQTRTEEVKLFLNRAINDSKSYYCMVNCHLLRFEVCKVIEQRLISMIDQESSAYGLAFIYAEEIKNPQIRSYLERHLVKHSSLTKSKKLREYVAELLTGSEKDDKSACCVDLSGSLCRLIRSDVSGVGKSLLKGNLCSKLRNEKRLPGKDITIPVYSIVNVDAIINRLMQDLGNDYFREVYHTIHLDFSYEVEKGVDELLFNLIVLRSIVNSDGIVWQARYPQYYIIECTPHSSTHGCAHEMMDLLPTTKCYTPDEVHKAGMADGPVNGLDSTVLAKTEWQTVLKYLEAHNQRKFTYNLDKEQEFIDKQKALQLLLENCGLKNPTWAELRHFVHFLYNQLEKVSTTVYCQLYYANSLRGFKPFVVDFMLKLAKDFATRSLVITEESSCTKQQQQSEPLLSNFEVKRKWEDSNHPYLFFNEDGESFTTLGFSVEKAGEGYCLVDLQTQLPFHDYTITRQLLQDLTKNGITFEEDFNQIDRSTQLKRLRSIMVNKARGCIYDSDPDANYVLTMDNAKKIAAIHQRLRVGIPVIIMGETGCGKTKLIEFMSKLQVPTELLSEIVPMITVKIHGGTTEADIIRKVKDAQELAKKNRLLCQKYALDSFLRQRKEQLANGSGASFGGATIARDNQQILECTRCYKVKQNSILLPCQHSTCQECVKMLADQKKEECLICTRVPKIYTVLFLDEANTTDAVGLVKEILCDGRMNGQAMEDDSDLKIIAACNPYRKHKKEMIEKLKRAGLGYCVDEQNASVKLGDIPMRHLVYRVHPLPRSLLPLVWDFGTLKSATFSLESRDDKLTDNESEYIIQMIEKFQETNLVGLKFDKYPPSAIAKIISRSQTFMRHRDDECSFVSLRDIQRLLDILAWFFKHRKILYPRMLAGTNPEKSLSQPEPVLLSLLLAIGVCYLTRLEEPTRVEYAEYISRDIEILSGQPEGSNGSQMLQQQIQLCQEIFVNEVVYKDEHPNIAKNKALMENIFMMIVCIENRIPLFVIGKPGSSKSLAKSLVFDSMNGSSSKSDIFKSLKTIYMASYQCSRNATPAGIMGVFAHCADLQTERDRHKFVSVVVLDEVGLAEDSENMPLKALHSLLEVENDTDGNIKPEKCAFIGISNWALDPAKMNRGIFIQRGSFDKEELLKIAGEIIGQTETQDTGVRNVIMPLADGFVEICKSQKPVKRNMTEFFGLRDYYSVIKMVANFAKQTGQLTNAQLTHSINRNFGGFDPKLSKPMECFESHCQPFLNGLGESTAADPPTKSIEFIHSVLSGEHSCFPGIESRYLLILTENLSVLSIIQDMLSEHDIYPEVVFGSKFPDDISYTQVCHNISRIKTCMELGKPVILLNLDELYESLYDALNQYFSTWGKRKYVDIGLGTHRVKAFVNDGFRLIVIASKDKVYSEFPIPLINRLEKHYVSATTLLTPDQLIVKEQLEGWMEKFVTADEAHGKMQFKCDGCKLPSCDRYQLKCDHRIGTCCQEKIESGSIQRVCPAKKCAAKIEDTFDWDASSQDAQNRHLFENVSVTSSFIGYSSELTALAIRKAEKEEDCDDLFERAKYHLLQCATGESVLRLDKSMLRHEAPNMQNIYFHEQHHETLIQYLAYELPRAGESNLLIQVTSFAQLMGRADAEVFHKHLNSAADVVEIRTRHLKQFTRESQFAETLRKFYRKTSSYQSKLMIVQCESNHKNNEMLEAVRYIIQRESDEAQRLGEENGDQMEAGYVPNHTVLLLSVPRGCDFSGYQGGAWQCVHIDDPRLPVFNLPASNECMEMKPSQIISGLLAGIQSEMDGDDPGSPPPLEEIDDVMNENNPDEYPDTELPDITNITESERRFLPADIVPFIKHCFPSILAIIKSAKKNHPVDLLRNLIDPDKNSEFLRAFLKQLERLLLRQEEFDSPHWVKDYAVSSDNMKTSETLRHAIEDAFERAIVPSMAAIISFIDVQWNLRFVSEQTELTQMWLRIFEESHKLGLSFDKLAVDGQSTLQRGFVMQDIGKKSQLDFAVQFPFSWLVKETIERLIKVKESMDQSGAMLEELFNDTPCGRVLEQYMNADNSKKLMSLYIGDFVYMSYPCLSTIEHEIVCMVINRAVQARYGEGILSPVHVHMVYSKMRPVMENLSTILNMDIPTDGKTEPIPERVKAFIDTEEGRATLAPCDLVAINFCFEALLASSRLRKLQEAPHEWIDQMDRVETIMSNMFDRGPYIQVISDLANKCRSKWQQLRVKKLYTEHVILPSPADPESGKKNSFKLNRLMKHTTDGNFQSYDTFQKVIDFLKERVKDGVRSLYPDCPELCPACFKDLDCPVKLACGHLLCESCTKSNEYCADGDCDATIDSNYQYSPTEGSVALIALKSFKDLRKRLNRFLMYFTSTLVFTSAAEPAPEIIKWLLNQVFTDKGTRKFVFYDSREPVDASPVLRSFLLKLFLRCEQSESITLSLDQMMATWNNTNMDEQLHNMTILIDCHKDLYERVQQYELPASVAKLMDSGSHLTNEMASEVTVEDLKAIAEIQCHISRVVDMILFTTCQQPMSDCEDSIKEFFKQTLDHGNNQASYFVVRQLLHKKGESYIDDLLKTRRSYLIPADIKEAMSEFVAPDVLAIYGGEAYRKAISDLDEVLRSFEDDGVHRAILKFYKATEANMAIHALFTMITRSFSRDAPVPAIMKKSLLDNLNTDERNVKDICRILLDPGRIPKGMDVRSSQGINLSMLVLHLFSVTQGNPGDLKPLVKIVTDPERAGNEFMPAIKANRVDMRDQLKISQGNQSPTDPIMLFCSEGHPYVIGSNSSSLGERNCRCGAMIRGLSTDDGLEQCLSVLPQPEHSVVPLLVLRCFTHLFMYISALFNPEKVMNMITSKPTTSADLERSLHEHVERDLEQISQCCEVSTDDCILLLHDIINNMSTRGEGEVAVDTHLSTIAKQSKWEIAFCIKYIRPTLINQNAVISSQRKELEAASKTSYLKQRVETSIDSITANNPLASPGLWEYRRPLTLTSIRNKTQHVDCPHLKKFVEHCAQLVAVSCLPDILTLTQLLSEKFHSRFSRFQALRTNIDEFCREYDHSTIDLRGKMNQFIRAWNVMVQTTRYGTIAQIELRKLPENPPVADFLFDIYSLNARSCSSRGQVGVAPFILVTFLVDIHNDMVQNGSNERSVIELPNAIHSNYVKLANEEEIVDLVLSHSEYGDTPDVSFDWAAIERELVLRYIASKPIIQLTTSYVPVYMYQEDFSLLNQLEAISDIQERMTPELEASITNTLTTNIQTLKDYLKELQVIINFLSAMSHIEKDKSLADFAKTTFGTDRDDTYLTPEVKLKHVRHIWFILKFTQAGQIIKQQLEPFDDVEPRYRRPLSEDLKLKLKTCCVYNSPRARLLLQLMFEFTVLRLNRAVSTDTDRRETANSSLADALHAFVAGQNDNSLMRRIADLPTLPAELLVEHSAQAWCHIWDGFTTPPSMMD